MKNAFGGLLNTRRHYTHSWIHETLVDLLAIQKEIHSGIFAVMDGTTAGNGPGPRTMYPEIKNVILASGDQVAIDAVAAKLMGFDPLTHPVHPAGARGRAGRRRSARDRAGRRHRPGATRSGASASATTAPAGSATSSGSGRSSRCRTCFMRTPLVNLFILGLGGLPRLLPLAGARSAGVRALAGATRRGASCSRSTAASACLSGRAASSGRPERRGFFTTTAPGQQGLRWLCSLGAMNWLGRAERQVGEAKHDEVVISVGWKLGSKLFREHRAVEDGIVDSVSLP